MGDTPTASPSPSSVAPPLVPAAPPGSSSLQGDSANDKALIESWVGDPGSPYWRGNDQHSAAHIQQHYRDLLLAEQLGAADPVGPLFAPDDDLPLAAEHYNIAAADGARSIDGVDRDIIDRFLPTAFSAGLGQRKVTQAIGWVLTIPGMTAQNFSDLAIAAGWSDRAIEICLGFYRKELGRQAGKT